ncbi:hypothetical protein N5923_23520 [Erwiniaceae bacterium BAC15a-03b]|uniref:Uncharacterized protein n=1 Tax=Winslowiella arboricola TaxID=2978220 RepID=A0A9J6PSM3_9GAMM|nr:hypothetical protein [Winslowiella arboricola]MCU5775080.1 hypothetical protein [Winslowiella arboricola]MCU5780466.1 hypothetical protein [Winslowiella arboricola]
MIVERKDGKWRVTKLFCGYLWRADLIEGYGVFAGKVTSKTMNAEQLKKWEEG